MFMAETTRILFLIIIQNNKFFFHLFLMTLEYKITKYFYKVVMQPFTISRQEYFNKRTFNVAFQ